jgi:hypothetical protein
VRVRQFELRLLAVALTVLWATGGGIVLIAYRPGGPVDVLVGVAASLPLLVCVAAIVWPPLVRDNSRAAGVFCIGLAAALLLIPSIASVVGQLLEGGTQALLPSAEFLYPWALALLATSLYAGLGVSRHFIPEVGFRRKRLAASIAFALVATSAIGGVYAGVSLADDAALQNKPAAYSRFGPTSANLIPPDCTRSLSPAASAKLAVDLWGDVDQRSVGTVSLTGYRSGSDVSWTAQLVRNDLFGQYGVVRIGTSAWTLSPGTPWQTAAPRDANDQLVDATALAQVLSATNRATAEYRGLEYVEGARARHCRVAVDGKTFQASFPQVKWLTKTAVLETWRGEINFWVFGDGEVGMITGSINGAAQEILPHGIQATIKVRMTATNRDTQVSILPPRT